MTFRRGFSLIEVMLVIGLISAVAGVGIPLYRDYQIRNDLNLATEQITQGLARARLLSQAAQNDDSWGFYAPAGILYKGDAYETRDASFDETYPMPSTITFQGLFDVNYGKITGLPDATGNITLTTINDETRNVLIEVRTESIAVVTADYFTICHNPGSGNPNTLRIPDNAWPGHQSHGDAFGSCEGDASSSSASSAHSSSSASSAASSASSSSAGASCSDRFAVAADGTITTLGSLTMTYRALGADITYGQGGPEIAVTVRYSKTGGTGPWTNLFGGNDIDGGETTTTSTIPVSSQVVTSFKGYYKHSGWLTFDQTYKTDDESGHIIMLRDGDPLPDYPAFNGQTPLKSYLQAIIGADGKIDISPYEVVYLVELGALNTSATDYQDAVVRLQFNTPSC